MLYNYIKEMRHTMMCFNERAAIKNKRGEVRMGYEIKNVYTIFFASSITELEIERLRLTNFVNQLSAKYLEKYFEIRLLPFICEDEDPCMAHAGKQTEYDDAIRESRMCFFVFHKKVGKYTEHELEVAKAAFDKTELPKIYFFFKKPHGEEFSSEVVALQAKLDKDFGHYYTFFDDIDTVHLRIVLQVMRQVLPEVSVELKDGKVLARNMPVPGVDPMSLPEFRNNKDLARMRKEYAKLDAECKKLYEKFKQPDCPADIIAEYSRKAAERARLKEETEQLLGDIFNISKEICSESGVVDAKRRAAYRYLEEGDSKKALEMLDEGELLAEGERVLSKAREARAEAQSLIDAWKLRIDILLTITEDEERFAKVRAAYDEIERLVDEFRVGTEKIRDYAEFLNKQNDHKLAYAKASKYVRLFEADKILGKNVTDEMLWEAYELMGAVALSAKQYGEALEYWGKAYELAQNLGMREKGIIYNDLGILHYRIGNYDKANHFYQQALSIRGELYAENPSIYATSYAAVYNNLGNLYRKTREYSESEKCHKEALAVKLKHSDKDPSGYDIYIARSYTNLGNLYCDYGDYDKAKECYGKALKIKEKLYAENPFEYTPNLATTYNGLGNVARNLKDYKAAFKWYEQALKLLTDDYIAEHPAYASNLAMTYKYIGELCFVCEEYDKAREYYERAVEMFEELYAENASAYAEELATVYCDLAKCCEAMGETELAKEYRNKSKFLK